MLNQSSNNTGSVKTNRKALRVLSSPALNRSGPAFTRTSKPYCVPFQSEPTDLLRTPTKKRKLSISSTSPLQSSPLKRVREKSSVSEEQKLEKTNREPDLGHEEIGDEEKRVGRERCVPVVPIRRSRVLETSGSICMRSMYGPQANRVTTRANSGAGKFLLLTMLLKCILTRLRVGGLDFDFLLATRR